MGQQQFRNGNLSKHLSVPDSLQQLQFMTSFGIGTFQLCLKRDQIVMRQF